MEKIKVIITQSLIDKLNSISQDIKVYINSDVHITNSLKDVEHTFPMMSKDDADELIDIRKRIKILSRKLEDFRNEIVKIP